MAIDAPAPFAGAASSSADRLSEPASPSAPLPRRASLDRGAWPAARAASRGTAIPLAPRGVPPGRQAAEPTFGGTPAPAGAARPDHHAIEIPPEPEDPARPGRADAGGAQAITAAVRRRNLFANLQRFAVTALSGSIGAGLAHRLWPDRGLGQASVVAGMIGSAAAIPVMFSSLSHSLSRPELRHLPLDGVIRSFCEPGSAAAHFDWTAPGLFVTDMGSDVAADVSHVLARAVAIAQTSAGSATRPALRRYIGNLAASAELRTDLAKRVAEVNGSCDDRLSMGVGELMLAGALHQARDPAAEPGNVVGILVLHAATQAVVAGLTAQVGVDVSSAVLLAGSHRVQDALERRGIAVPRVFLPPYYSLDEPLLRDWRAIRSVAQQVADAACWPPAPGQLPGGGIVELLQRHGGEAAEEILSARLRHLTDPLVAALADRVPVVGHSRWLSPDEQRQAAAAQHEYGTKVAAIRARAIAGALAGSPDDWVVPAQPEGRAGAPAVTGTVARPGQAAACDTALQAPPGHDPVRGKWAAD